MDQSYAIAHINKQPTIITFVDLTTKFILCSSLNTKIGIEGLALRQSYFFALISKLLFIYVYDQRKNEENNGF